MKKILSLILVTLLVFGSISSAFGTTRLIDIVGENCEEAVETLVALGIINGYHDGTFRPEKVVTRAEIAKMLIVALGYEDLLTGTTRNFSDTARHWADAYIAFAAGQGIVYGYPDGTFKPDATVSYDEAITMILRALGYTDDCLNGTWPTNYKIKALDLDITDGVKIRTGGADRGGVAMLIYNALECNLVYINGDNEITNIINNNDDTISLLDRLGDKTTLLVTPDTIDEDSNEYVESNIDLEPYMFETLEVKTVDDVVVYISDTLTATLEGDVYDIRYSKIYVEEEDGDKEHFSYASLDTNDLYFNGAVAKTTSFSDLEDEVYGGAKVKVVFETNSKGKIVTTSPVGIVAWLKTDKVQIDDEYDDDDLDIDGIDLPVTTDRHDDEIVDYNNLTVEGHETSLEDIEEDDIVTIYASDVDKKDDKNPQAVKLVVTRDTKEGKITKIKDKDTVVINRTTFDIADDSHYHPDLGEEGVFFLDENGDIFGYDVMNKELTNYAVVIGTADGIIDEKFGDIEIDSPAQIKLARVDNKTKIYDMYYDIDDKEGCTLDGSQLLRISITDSNNDILEFRKSLEDDLVLFDTNREGEIDELEKVHVKEEENIKVSGNKLGDKYRFTSNTIIFDAADKYEVIDLEDLDDRIDADVVVDEDSLFGNLEVVIVYDGAEPTSDGTYALILDVYETLNDDDDNVQELKTLVEGKKQTLFTKEDDLIEEYDYMYKLLLSELTLNSDGEVTDCEFVDTIKTSKLVDAIDVDDLLIRVNGTNYTISDDIVVYVAEYDEDDNEWTVETGDLSDIEEDEYVTIYDVDRSEDDGLDFIIIYTDNIEEKNVSVSTTTIQEKDLATATIAVEIAEYFKWQEDINGAQDLIDELPDSKEKADLQERLDAIKVK